MTFEKIDSINPVVDYLADTIASKLNEGKKVLWLLTGGSGIAIDTEVSRRLLGKDLSHLMVTLTDERYGPVGHSDSNWQQLLDAGFDVSGAQVLPVLDGSSEAETVGRFADTLRQFFEQADYKIGLFGMGADGHTAGMLPHSPALSSMELATSYASTDHFIRITMTPSAIAMLDEAVLCARGEEKLSALQNLNEDIPVDQQPAQLLKKLSKMTVFNDQIGDQL